MKTGFSQRIVSSVLVIWMSGVVLLFCCGNMQARVAEADSCPLAKAGHCDKQSNNENAVDFASFQRETGALDCCGFLPKLFDKARKIEKNPQAAIAATVAKTPAPKFSFVIHQVKAPKIYQSAVRNRGSTYLKNCVFRI
jgi:hypothetical protein